MPLLALVLEPGQQVLAHHGLVCVVADLVQGDELVGEAAAALLPRAAHFGGGEGERVVGDVGGPRGRRRHAQLVRVQVAQMVVRWQRPHRLDRRER